MNAPTRIGAFAIGLTVLFGGALVVGDLVGPLDEPVAAKTVEHGMDMGMDMGVTDGHGAHEAEPSKLPGGLMVSEGGYTLALTQTASAPGKDRPIAFVIEGPDGAPVTSYDVEHEKELHFIAVRRDYTGFQHVHPVRGADGTWRTNLDLTAGQWRVFADFKPADDAALTLGSDLSVAGNVSPATPRPVTRIANLDGYTVTLEGDLKAGEHSRLTLSVFKDGKPVTDLQPYLGAYGHLVTLREGDLAYLHVHPASTNPGPQIAFGAEVPSGGSYHLYLDFKHGDVVRTAQFKLEAGGH